MAAQTPLGCQRKSSRREHEAPDQLYSEGKGGEAVVFATNGSWWRYRRERHNRQPDRTTSEDHGVKIADG